MRASLVVNRQSGPAVTALRFRVQAATMIDHGLLSGDAEDETLGGKSPSSDSARSSQLPCLGA